MELQHKINKALRIVESLSAADRLRLERICENIRHAQDVLNESAEAYFRICLRKCRGICCKNINVNDVVSQLDLIYAIAMKQELSSRLLACSNKETIYTADCPFLKDGRGPCLFPHNIKPERCIITFCGETKPIRGELKAVRSGFSKLSRFTKLKRPFLWIRF